jgi:hypothetical protein
MVRTLAVIRFAGWCEEVGATPLDPHVYRERLELVK